MAGKKQVYSNVMYFLLSDKSVEVFFFGQKYKIKYIT